MNQDEYTAFDVDGEIHLVPDMDIDEHEPSRYCQCVPIGQKKEKLTKEGVESFWLWEHRLLRDPDNQH